MKNPERLHDDTPNEILHAEREVDEGRRDLELTLSRLDQKVAEAVEVVRNRVEDVSGRATAQVTQVRDRIEGTIRSVDESVNQLGTEITGAAAEVSQAVEVLASEVTGSITDIRSEVSGRVKDVTERISETVEGFGSRVTSALDVGSDISNRVDSFISSARSDLSRMMDQAEDIADRLRDPSEFLAKNPGLVAPILLIAGMVVGLLFRDTFASRRLRNMGATEELPAGGGIEVDATIRRVA